MRSCFLQRYYPIIYGILDAFSILIDIFSTSYFISEIIKGDLTTPTQLVESISDFEGIVLLIWVMLDSIPMLTNHKQRAIHDFVAGSVVIKTEI